MLLSFYHLSFSWGPNLGWQQAPSVTRPSLLPLNSLLGFKIGFHIAESGLEVVVQWRTTLNSWSACLHLLNAGTTGVHPNMQFRWCWEWSPPPYVLGKSSANLLCQEGFPPFLRQHTPFVVSVVQVKPVKPVVREPGSYQRKG